MDICMKYIFLVRCQCILTSTERGESQGNRRRESTCQWEVTHFAVPNYCCQTVVASCPPEPKLSQKKWAHFQNCHWRALTNVIYGESLTVDFRGKMGQIRRNSQTVKTIKQQINLLPGVVDHHQWKFSNRLNSHWGFLPCAEIELEVLCDFRK